MKNQNHYTECGLDNIYLLNGFEKIKTDFGVGIKIFNQSELHAVIGLSLVQEPHLLESKEIRFLRVEMGLSQKNLGHFIGMDAQTIARWEKKQSSISAPADRLIKLLYLEHIHEESSVRKLCDDLSNLDNYEEGNIELSFKNSDGWTVAA